MRTYEVVVVMDPNLEVDGSEALIERLTTVVGEQGGSVTNVDRWGKRRLAYEIEGHREGNYAVMTLQGPTTMGSELERVMKIADGIIRSLLVRKDEE